MRALCQLTEAKARALRVKSAIEQARAVPVERVTVLVENLVDLLKKYTPPEREGQLMRDLRLLGARVDEPTGNELATRAATG